MLPEVLDNLRAADEANDALPQGVVGGNAGTGRIRKALIPSSELAA